MNIIEIKVIIGYAEVDLMFGKEYFSDHFGC
jgi:hypothetical protein